MSIVVSGASQKLSTEQDRHDRYKLRGRGRECFVVADARQKGLADPDWIGIEHRRYEGTNEEGKNQDFGNPEIRGRASANDQRRLHNQSAQRGLVLIPC
jgi:hypothetical protein